MEVVKAFNTELQSLYDTKPPISKAKMTLITRSAMKAIKFYKHVVQSVEKFIQKCKPEYKVPGLYVIDSIVRQSRHQYTPEKDVFAPRFSRNIKTTFLHLFNCSQEDKSKIVRVLNLWQKNNVFTADVIQPLLDLAASVANKDTVSTNGALAKTPPTQPRTPNSKNSPIKDPAWLTGGRNQPDAETKSTSAVAPKVKMDKKLFEYDYGEDDDDDRAASASPIRNQSQNNPAQQTPLPNLESLSSILSNPEVLRQLHTLQQQMAARQQQQELEEKMRRLQEMKHQEEEFDRHLAQTLPKLPFAAECELQPNLSVAGVNSGVSLPPTSVPPPNVAPTSVPPPSGVAPPTGVPLPGSNAGLGPDGTPTLSLGANMPTAFLSQIDLPPLMVQPPPVPPPSYGSQPSSFPSLEAATNDYDERTRTHDTRGKEHTNIDEKEMDDAIEVIDLVRSPSTRDSDHRRYRNRSRSKDRYRNRSRSHSRSRRRRSRSSDRDSRDRDFDRKQKDNDREKERERKKKGLPSPRRNHLTVCSTTLWIGHLSKLIHEDQLSNIFGEYGDIVSINLIPPRGCAFVCMNRRQDAMKALHELKHFKIQSKSITVAWAPGKGMKEKEWKDYWEVEHGASFIPWNKLNPKTNFELLEEGGMLDQDTFPEWLKETYSTLKKQMDERKAKEEDAKKAKMEELPPLPSGPQPPPAVPPSSQPDMRGPPPPQPPPPTPLPPPPMGMLPPPPFPLQPPGLLGPMGMSMPPGLVGPLGVPPPIMVPQQMIPRMPPPFNAPPQSFGLMDGMPPPPMSNAGNPFGPPIMAGVNANNNNINTNTSSNKDPTEMDVDESEEETPKKDEIMPLPPNAFPVMPPLPNLAGNNREVLEANSKKPDDNDMRVVDEQNRKRKWNGDDDSFRHRNNRWPERDRDRRGGGGSPHERRNDERPPLIPNAPVMPPDFPPFPNNRHGVRGPDDEDVYPPAMIDFPPRDFQSRDFSRDFPPRGGANHFFSPRGPMFGPRGPPPGHSPMNMRPPRHPGLPGIRGAGDGRGGWCPPPPQQGPPPPRGARFPLLHPPPMVPPNRRMPGERKSRWGEPVEQPSDDMFLGQPEDMFSVPAEEMFPGPPREVTEDRLPEKPSEILSDHLLKPPGSEPFSNIIEESKITSEPSNNTAIIPPDISVNTSPVNHPPDPIPCVESEHLNLPTSLNEPAFIKDSIEPTLSQPSTSPHVESVEECPTLSSNNDVPSETPIDMFSDITLMTESKIPEETLSVIPENAKSDDIFFGSGVENEAQNNAEDMCQIEPTVTDSFPALTQQNDNESMAVETPPSELTPFDPVPNVSLYSPEPTITGEANNVEKLMETSVTKDITSSTSAPLQPPASNTEDNTPADSQASTAEQLDSSVVEEST